MKVFDVYYKCSLPISHKKIFSSNWPKINSPECVALLNRTLRNERHTIVVLRAALVNSMPVNGHFHALHMVLHVDHHLIVFAHLNTGSGNHAVCGQHTSFNTVGQHALAMAPDGIGGVRCAHLAGTVNEES